MTDFLTRVLTGLDDETRVVLLLAYHRESIGRDTLDTISRALYGPEQVARVNEIADALDWAVRLHPTDGWEPITEVLRQLTGEQRVFDAWGIAAQLAEEKETDAVRAAQQVAQMVRRGAAA